MRNIELEDLSWLHALARSLVRDPHRADDAVQDTLVVALDREPRDPRKVRGWLATILRNVVRQTLRGEARRERRDAEPRVSATTAPSTLEVVEELALHRELVELVEALDEPFRTAVHLRYLRGMTPREIASSQQVPVKTVHSRIERALERLRGKLDRAHGGKRDAWVVALLPLARAPLAAPPTSGGAGLAPATTSAGLGLGSVLLTMNAKVILSCACAVAIGAALYLDRRGDEVERAGPKVSLDTAAATPPLPRNGTASLDAPAAERLAVETPALVEDAPDAPSAAPRIEGDVRELDGRAVRDVDVVFVPGAGDRRVVATSGDGGVFSFDAPDARGRLSVQSELYACLSGSKLDGGVPAERPIVVVTPRRRYAGRVVDESGAPLPDTRVEIALPGESGLLFTVTLPPDGRSAHVLQPLAEAFTDDDGRFHIDSVAALAGATIEASRDGFDTASRALTAYDDLDLELTLVASKTEPRSVFGVVLDPNGVPVRGAFVSYGYGSGTVSDPDGRFMLRRHDWVEAVTLRALVRGRLPASLAYDPARATEGHTQDDPVRLFVGGEPLAIAGRVVDARGEPVAGAEVWTPDVSYFGSTTHSDGEKSLTGESLVEALITGRPNPMHPRHVGTRTDASGRFRVEGLLDRSYTIFAVVPSTLAAAEPRRIRAGTSDATLRLTDDETQRVAGRLVSLSGTPLADVRVALGHSAPDASIEERELSSWNDSPLPVPSFSRNFLDAATVRTDADGRFAFEALHTRGASLLFVGDALQWPHTEPLTAAADLESLRIAAKASCRFRVVLESDPGEADAFKLVDEHDNLQPLLIPVSDAVISAPSADLVDGRSGVVIGAEGAVTIVLLRGGEEVRRVAVDLPAGAGHEVGL